MFRYKCYFYDEDVNLYYLKSRFYNPLCGRFLTDDDEAYIDESSFIGFNLFTYCGNDPVNKYDPNGNFAFFIATAAIGSLLALGAVALIDYIPDKEFNLHWGWYVGAGILGALIGAAAGMAISYYATGSITSSTGKVFSGLFGKTTLYRSVGADELADIQKTGKFNLGNGMEVKQFGLSLDETRMFGNHPIVNQTNIVGVKIPNRVFFRLDFTTVDVDIFKSGIVTVRSFMIDTFNNNLLGIIFL